jgi:hypothetical protein
MKPEAYINDSEVFIENSFEVMKRKAKEYADASNVFSNFEKATGLSFHNERESVLWEYMVKHLQSIKDMIDCVEVGGEVQGHFDSALVDEKIGDAINYLLILRSMLNQRINDSDYERFAE